MGPCTGNWEVGMCTAGNTGTADPTNALRFTEVAHPSLMGASLSTTLDYDVAGHPPYNLPRNRWVLQKPLLWPVPDALPNLSEVLGLVSDETDYITRVWRINYLEKVRARKTFLGSEYKGACLRGLKGKARQTRIYSLGLTAFMTQVEHPGPEESPREWSKLSTTLGLRVLEKTKAYAQKRRNAQVTLMYGREGNRVWDQWTCWNGDTGKTRPTEAGFQRRDTRAHHSPRTLGLLWWQRRFTSFCGQCSASLRSSPVAHLCRRRLDTCSCCGSELISFHGDDAPPPVEARWHCLITRSQEAAITIIARRGQQSSGGDVILRELYTYG